jgi:hypothetical protein
VIHFNRGVYLMLHQTIGINKVFNPSFFSDFANLAKF